MDRVNSLWMTIIIVCSFYFLSYNGSFS